MSDNRWLEAWRRQSLDELTARLERNGAPEPREWASSEIDEDIPQLARFLVLRGIWRRALDETTEASRTDAAKRLLAGSGTPNDLDQLLKRALYRFAFSVAYLLDMPDGTSWGEEPRTDVGDDEPRWELREIAPDGEPTGRAVDGLHESLNEVVSEDDLALIFDN